MYAGRNTEPDTMEFASDDTAEKAMFKRMLRDACHGRAAAAAAGAGGDAMGTLGLRSPAPNDGASTLGVFAVAPVR